MDNSNVGRKITEITGKEYGQEFFVNQSEDLKTELYASGVAVLQEFLSPEALTILQQEASLLKRSAYRSKSSYNLYVLPNDRTLDGSSPRNRRFMTSKRCIADDQIPKDSFLRTIYNSTIFRTFVCTLEGTSSIFPYADTLSSININYYDPGDSLEWHFDNADLAITLLLKQCNKGGSYEYFPDIRYTPDGKENYEALRKAIDGELSPKIARMNAGALMLFRGNKSLHRVTKIEAGERILVTLNYNLSPGVSLSEKSRMTFFGRKS